MVKARIAFCLFAHTRREEAAGTFTSRVHVFIYTHAHMHIYTGTHKHIHAGILIHAHACIYIYVHTHI